MKKWNSTPLSAIRAIVPSRRTKPRGTACLYVNQKSKMSPSIMTLFASGSMLSSQRTISSSRCRLSAPLPRCASVTKKVLVPIGFRCLLFHYEFLAALLLLLCDGACAACALNAGLVVLRVGIVGDALLKAFENGFEYFEV